jgi:hypothetical protein
VRALGDAVVLAQVPCAQQGHSLELERGWLPRATAPTSAWPTRSACPSRRTASTRSTASGASTTFPTPRPSSPRRAGCSDRVGT